MGENAKEGGNFRVLFISSSSRFRLPERRSAYRKKFRGLSKIGDMNYIAVSDDGGRRHACVGAMELHLAPKTGFKPLDVMLFLIFALLEGLKIIRKRRINIIYAQSPLLDGCIGCLLRTLTGCKLIVGIHGDWAGEIQYSKPGLARFLPLINLIAKMVLRNADVVRVISEATKRRALEFIQKDKIFPVMFPAFFDAEFFLERKIKHPKEDSVVFVGSLIGRKGVKYLLGGIRTVIAEYPKFRLYILGRGNKEGELKDLCRRLGIEDNVQFLGHQPAEVVMEYIDRSLALVLPSLSEGLGRAALEAMARGRPVIGSRVEGILETVNNDRGYLIPPKDSNAISSAILSILRNKAEAMDKGMKGREYVAGEYSLEKYLNNYKELFHFTLRDA